MNGMHLTPALLAVSQNTTHARPREPGDTTMPVQQDGNAKDPALWEVSQKFEAMLMQQMMSAMRKTVPASGLLPSGFAGDMYASMFDQAIAETGSKSGSLGIAENIYRHMSAAGPGRMNMQQGNPPAGSVPNPDHVSYHGMETPVRVKVYPVSADTDTGGQAAGLKE